MAYAEPNPDAMVRTTFILTIIGVVLFALAAVLIVI